MGLDLGLLKELESLACRGRSNGFLRKHGQVLLVFHPGPI